MRLNLHKNFIRNNLNEGTYLDGRIGFWADVVQVNSETNSCDVVSDTGVYFSEIQVASKEWVNPGDNFVSGERDLPPVGARVFVLCPSHTATGGVIICSGYTRGDTNLHTLYAQSSDEREEKNNIREKVSCSGWNITEEYANGNKKFTSPDSNIVITVNPVKKDADNPQEVSIKAWNNEIHITKDGISIVNNGTTEITAKDNVTINAKDKNINITAASFNVNDGNLEVSS